ncbi:ABC transporter substrate-binding protein [Pedobacter alpinus]|uniref:ABC transporter substrate-binding protein n=1 Tax=Pedobacter alpinus TaxID=1590643 RepID=A0ABW5TUB6_9SPHI
MIFIDQLSKEIEIKYPPKRIISLVPSQTELLFDLGLNEEIVGVTKFCIHPKDKVKQATKIGGTKKLDIDKIRQLKPDLIIGNKEENQKEDIELLMQEFPVWMSDIYNLEDALNMILGIGALVCKKAEAKFIIDDIENSFSNLLLSIKNKPRKKAAYFIWKAPNMLAGSNTYINEMLKYCGLQNIVEQQRYPSFTTDELLNLQPEVVLLSSEPYPFTQKHVLAYKNIWPNAKVELVDGEMFSWYGSRLKLAANYFKQLNSNLF